MVYYYYRKYCVGVSKCYYLSDGHSDDETTQKYSAMSKCGRNNHKHSIIIIFHLQP